MGGTDRSLSITVEDPDAGVIERHYNVDNIAFLRVSQTTLKQNAFLLMGFVSLAVTFIVTRFFFLIGLIAGVAVFGILFYLWQDPGSLRIGTVGETDEVIYDESTLSSIEREFKTKASESIRIDGDYETLSRKYKYTYYFIPDNIVNIERGEQAPLFAYLVFGIVLISFLAFGFSLIDGDIGITVISLIIIILGLFIQNSLEPINALQFTMQGGEKRGFTMSPSDARRVLDQFGTRR